MPKMNEGLSVMLEDYTKDLTEEEEEKLEDALSEEQQKKLEKALQTFFNESEEIPNKVNNELPVLINMIIELAIETEAEEEEEEEGGGEKKVKKSHDWGFTLVPPKTED